MRKAGNALGLFIFPAGHDSPWISRYLEVGEGKLEWRTCSSRVASLPRLHGVATDGAAHPLRSSRTHLVRWIERPAQVRRYTLRESDPQAPAWNFDQRSHRRGCR